MQWIKRILGIGSSEDGGEVPIIGDKVDTNEVASSRMVTGVSSPPEPNEIETDVLEPATPHELASISTTSPQRGSESQTTEKPQTEITDLNDELHSIDSQRLVQLGSDQQKVFDLVKNSRESVFITGRAGSGKSFLLRHIAANFRDRMIVVAPTGAAALNSGGVTIHKAFSLPPGFLSENEIRAKAEESMRYTQRVLLRKIESLVIDEISMVRADLMNAINIKLQVARESNEPFGGVQIIAFGDPLQLPPVVGDEALSDYFADTMGGPYFFNSQSWKSLDPTLLSLEESHRQSDARFLEALDQLRFGNNDWSNIELINERWLDGGEIPGIGVPVITPRNAQADEINHSRLATIPGDVVKYTAVVSGDDLRKLVPTQVELQLKPGAQVLMVVNDVEQRWVNGTMGVIESLQNDQLEVRIRDVVHTVARHTWQRISYRYNKVEGSITSKVEGEFTQFPVALGWARTVHKAQGQTFDSCAVELGRGGAFAPGQAYVALSRCKSLERLFLISPLERRDIFVDPVALKFMSEVKPVSEVIR